MTTAHTEPVSIEGALRGANLKRVRPAGVADRFYPGDPAVLTAAMDEMLGHVPQQAVEGRVAAIVAPHAGYPFSGPVAAYAYAALRGLKFARVVVIAPSHYDAFPFTSVYEGDGYATPLGAIPVDTAFAAQLAKASGSIRLSSHGHLPGSHGVEHAIEVQLPWLQHVVGSFDLVPVIMGDQSYESCRSLGCGIARLIAQHASEGDTLIVASSDLSHFHSYSDAEVLDHKTLRALESWDYFSMARNFPDRVWEACGGGPMVAAMIAAERLGANHAALLRYANSGDVTGDHSRVVGYGAVAIVNRAESARDKHAFSLSEEQKQTLLGLARTSVEHVVGRKDLYQPAPPADSALNRESGAFVTLKKGGALRGCIGYASAAKPLYLTVRDTASLAAFRDPRFQPVEVEELPALEYEISVLSPFRRVSGQEQIEVGRDGLLVKNGKHEGLLLPQVAPEQHWDRSTFLAHTCIKAGLPPDAWKDEGSDVFAFTAVVFATKEEAATE